MPQTLQSFLQTPRVSTKLCSLDCGTELSGADPYPSIVIDGVGEICADCESAAISAAIDQHPVGKPMKNLGH